LLYKRFLLFILFNIGIVFVGFAAFLVAPAGISLAQERVNHRFTETACLDCHTDQARLQELAPAKENVEEAEALSSGPG
jgi:hypothetical protein